MKSNEQFSGHSLLQPLLIMLIILSELLRTHTPYRLLNHPHHVLPLHLLFLLEPRILSLDLTEDILYRVQLRRISGYVPHWTIQLLDFGLDYCSMMHTRVVQDQYLIRLQVIQIMLQKLTYMLASHRALDYLRGLKTTDRDCSQQCYMLTPAGRKKDLWLLALRRPPIMASSLQAENGLIKKDLLIEGYLLYHLAISLTIQQFIIGISLQRHFLQFLARYPHPGQIGMYGRT